MRLIILSHVNASINAFNSTGEFMLPSSNDYMSHLQDVITVQLTIKQFVACQLEIMRVVLQSQHNN